MPKPKRDPGDWSAFCKFLAKRGPLHFHEIDTEGFTWVFDSYRRSGRGALIYVTPKGWLLRANWKQQLKILKRNGTNHH